MKLDFSGFGKKKGENSLSARANTAFPSDEAYPLAVVITILKHKSLHRWGMDDSTEILTSIASLRECILEQSDLVVRSVNLNQVDANRENSNAIFKLGQVATTFNLLCERNGVNSPLVGLKGDEVTKELYKLAILDKAFYGTKDAFVATEDLIIEKQCSNPNDVNDGFSSIKTQHKFANIKLYDTVILLKVLASNSPDIGAHLSMLLSNLEDAVYKRMKLENKKEQCIEFISKNKDSEKNLKLLSSVNSEIEDLGRKLGALETNLETIAKSKGLPNAFNSNLNTREVWESLSNMFEVLNQPSNTKTHTELNTVKEPVRETIAETTPAVNNEKTNK